MAKHKAATEVSIAPKEEKSAFAAFIDRAWKPAAVVAAVVSITILAMIWNRQTASRGQAESWDSLLAVGTTEVPGQFDPSIEDLEAVEQELEGTVAGPWGLILLAEKCFDDQEYDEAAAVVARLRERYPDHPMVTTTFQVGAAVTPQSLADVLETRIAQQKKWDAENPGLFSNPDPAPDAPQVRFNTPSGAIVIALYPERAPKHVENFLKLVGEGYYDGTRFHRIMPGSIIQGGDPNSRDDDRSTWGLGGPDYEVEHEKSGLHHFEGFLSAAKKGGAVDSSGSQFFITCGPNHQWDGEYVVYGKIVEGLDIAQEISTAPLEEGRSDRPAEPVVLETAEVL